MHNKTAKITLIVFLLVAIMVVAMSFSLAYWGGNSSFDVDGPNSSVINQSKNTTYKYMIFKANINNGDYFLKYSGNSINDTSYGKFVGYDLYGEGIETVDKSSFSDVTLVGYTGTLGEYEDLKVPSKIDWYINDEVVALNVTTIEMDVTNTNFKDSLSLIKTVYIPSSITAVKGASFTSCEQLTAIYFDAATCPTIGEFACIGDIKFYKKQGENFVETTITREGE